MHTHTHTYIYRYRVSANAPARKGCRVPIKSRYPPNTLPYPPRYFHHATLYTIVLQYTTHMRTYQEQTFRKYATLYSQIHIYICIYIYVPIYIYYICIYIYMYPYIYTFSKYATVYSQIFHYTTLFTFILNLCITLPSRVPIKSRYLINTLPYTPRYFIILLVRLIFVLHYPHEYLSRANI